MPTVTTRIPDDVATQLKELANDTSRSKSFHVAQALEEYLAKNAWQVARIRQSLEGVNRGEFASEEEVKTAFAEWGFDVDNDA